MVTTESRREGLAKARAQAVFSLVVSARYEKWLREHGLGPDFDRIAATLPEYRKTLAGNNGYSYQSTEELHRKLLKQQQRMARIQAVLASRNGNV